MACIKRSSIGVAVAVALMPGVCWAWGTLTDLLPMRPDEEQSLRSLLNNCGTNTAQSLAEILPRRGPHPTHQFIMRQAYFLLERDPAYKDSPWKPPAIESVLAWDGIVRQTGAGGGLDGMRQRPGAGTGIAAALAPVQEGVAGPSADAEITANGKWNPDYVAARHYWNPWLKCGDAPKAVGSCYLALVKAMIYGGDENAKAKAASHMGHYLADAICPKHADMIPLDEKTLKELATHADAWSAEKRASSKMTLDTWLASARVTQASNLIVKASGVSLDHPWWRRVNAHIANNTLLRPSRSRMRPYPDVGAPSLRASAAGLLAALSARADKDLVRFYGFFDPFYYNGQLVMTYDWSANSAPEVGLVTPAGEHVMWETDPAINAYIAESMNNIILGNRFEKLYVALPENADLWSPDYKKRMAAYRDAAAEFTRKAALKQHGSSPANRRDFDHRAFDKSLELPVKYCFNALRACITAIRCEPAYAHFPTEGKYRIYCDLSNAADEPVEVKAIRISISRDGKLLSCPQWVKSVSCQVSKDTPRRITVELLDSQVKEKAPQFYVDVHGRYDKTPDLGFWRGEVSQRPPRIMHGMSLPAFGRVEGALDLAICFDVTGSMGSSINSVRDNAINVLGKLRKRLGDMRVALVSFRDIEEDKGDAFSVTPFTPNIKQAIAKMKNWRARGGGDIPEDQLQAIRLALDLWGKDKVDPRLPTKIVVVITDAPPHDPDLKGDTIASIADYAERVDPAHIYPIVVGSSLSASIKAEKLAKATGGEVLTAKSGEEVASVLATAVEKAVATHGTARRAQLPPWLLFYGGLSASLVGAFWIWRDRRKRMQA